MAEPIESEFQSECARCGALTHYFIVVEARELVPVCSRTCRDQWQSLNYIEGEVKDQVDNFNVARSAELKILTVEGDVSV